MKKIFFVICFFISFLFSSEIKELKSFEQLEENKKIFLVFSTFHCPWCSKQKRVLEDIEVTRDDLQIVYVNDSSNIYKELLDKYPFVIKYYPTSYILFKEENDLSIVYEFQGYQKESNILKVLNDEDSF